MERGELEVARAPSRAPWGFLAQAVSLLAASLDLETTLANVVQLAVPALADWCGIDLIEPDGSMRPIAGMHSDPQRQRLLDELQRRYGDQRIGTMARVTETGQRRARRRGHRRDAREQRARRRAPRPAARRRRAAPTWSCRCARAAACSARWCCSPPTRRGITARTTSPPPKSLRPGARWPSTTRACSPRRATPRSARTRAWPSSTACSPMRRSVSGSSTRSCATCASTASWPRSTAAPSTTISASAWTRSSAATLGAQVARDCLKVIETGEPLLDLEVTGEPVFPGRRRVWLANYYPVRMGLGGEVTGVGTVVQEITERKRVERRASFLAEAERAPGPVARHEADAAQPRGLTVPELADWFAVDLLGSDEEIRRAAVAHADPAKTALGVELARRFPATRRTRPASGAPSAAAARSCCPEVPDDVIDRSPARRPDYAEILRGLGLSSTMIVPLRARGRILGGDLAGGGRVGPRASTRRTLRWPRSSGGALRAGASTTPGCTRSARATARTLQASLLPPALPEHPGLELAARYRAAGEGNEVGGDFYDVFATADGDWAVVIGDVCGKGPEAAASPRSPATRCAPRRAATSARRPRSCRRSTTRCCASSPATSSAPSRCGRIQPDDGGALRASRSACGGHPPPLRPARRRPRRAARRSGHAARRGRRTAPPGRRARARAPATRSLLYTDGVTEARVRSWELGEEGLVSAARGLRGPGRGRDRGDDRARRGRRAGGRAARRHRAAGPQSVGRVER